ncbi:hypothetical protein JSY36_02435 [Bacillus sp. H-16]|uniref:TcaA NTF2-like domain-containing protein n=1 Tax=Alteribacter salitolerans TaxID=2912333 RepID=UPI001962438B|nr:hypothetical protein [Alteribacter salitolerans]MBM7094602.1 hypothetical protein [Alteribacter salitolerans]
MQKRFITLTLTLILIGLIAACDDPEWSESNEETALKVEEFMGSFKDAWYESLTSQSFRPIEEYLYPNSQFFHMKRRIHQQYSTQRVIEETVRLDISEVEETEDGEIRVTVEEEIEQSGAQTGVEERIRTYYLHPYQDTYRVTSMERHSEE